MYFQGCVLYLQRMGGLADTIDCEDDSSVFFVHVHRFPVELIASVELITQYRENHKVETCLLMKTLIRTFKY